MTVWQALPPSDQARVLGCLVERVNYEAAQQTVSIAFRPDAGTALAEELARSTAEAKRSAPIESSPTDSLARKIQPFVRSCEA